MKSVDTKSKPYINFNKENNYKNPKVKVGVYVKILKYKNSFEQGYIPNCFE